MCYRLIKAFLFRLPPEVAHYLTLRVLTWLPWRTATPALPTKVFGLDFLNPIGLAAGLDKNGDYVDALAKLGFGFIEIGTVTPQPQKGNPKPRLFRLPKYRALINRMGFNNKGIDHLIEQIKQRKYPGILGINIGKNSTTPIEKAVQDYLTCFTKAYPYADYITVNISSPNTQGLRDLQHGTFLEDLLSTLKTAQIKLTSRYKKYVPLVVKVAPDLDETEVKAMANTLKQYHVDGLIATNTTIQRFGIDDKETGGLSGAPLIDQSIHILQWFKRELGDEIPIISSGGMMSPEVIQARFAAGAKLVQIYTGLIYEGPHLITQAIQTLYQNHDH